ncbi:DUF1919 domain-containing protein [Hymenobacter cellulosilyticus]|uniref:DUF1919 domain-containing protein n=1 Tax=Hymenobacter cellulosilyticus TaxID=2932248 RepID=A0A8T9QB67_9BACT|nr:DUF1919 domain-containing protein [Hymenobacter cellulosilyticus]UOQ74425.1 DUF1919 domain-containing protein [Hymenobacter cellulosilyticus]
MSILGRVRNKINEELYQRRRRREQQQLQNRDFTLISNDCWGAEVYKHFELPFNTPFIGLMLMAPDYIELLRNPKHYLSQPLVFQEKSRYDIINELQKTHKHPFPVATLGDKVELQFLHYHSQQEAAEKWPRRVARINWDNLRVKFDGSKDFATPELVREFTTLPYQKLLLLEKPVAGVPQCVVVPEYTTNGMELFRRSLPHFDLLNWIQPKSA